MYKLATKKVLRETVFIHYGADKFDPKKFIPVQNDMDKVRTGTGLWVCPTTTKLGWINFLKNERINDFNTHNSFELKIKTNAKIIQIDNYTDLATLPTYNPFKDLKELHYLKQRCYNVELLFKKGIDGIYLSESGLHTTRLTLPKNTYTWDCESLIIFNKNIIKPIKNFDISK